MIRVVWATIILLLACTWASADGLVWKVQNKNSTIYLGGSFHALRERDYPLPPEYLKAYQASDVLVVETDLGKLEDPAVQMMTLSKAQYSDGTTLQNHLSPEVYGKLTEFCQRQGLSVADFARFKPSMTMVALVSMEILKAGFNPQLGVDRYFYDLAHKDKKKIEELETVYQQVQAMASMGDGVENDFVLNILKDLDSTKANLETMSAAWRKGEEGKLDDVMNREIKGTFPKLYKKLLLDRNAQWLPIIERYLKSPGRRFVLVGAGHLVGPDGLIEAFRRRGYKIERM